MGGSIGSTSTNTATYATPPGYVAQAYKNIVGQAQNVAATPYTPYSGQLTSGLSGAQTQAISGLQGAQGAYQPYYDQAANYGQQSTTALAPMEFSADAIAKYQNPYTQQVVDATLADLGKLFGTQQNQVTGNAITSGAWGGDRAGIVKANLAGTQAQQAASTLAGLRQSSYDNAVQQFNTANQTNLGAQQQNNANALAAAGLYQNLGTGASTNAVNLNNALLGAGGVEQQTDQAALDAAYQQFLNQQQYPFQTLSWLTGLTTGVGSNAGGFSTSDSSTTGGGLSFSYADGGAVMPYSGGKPQSGLALPIFQPARGSGPPRAEARAGNVPTGPSSGQRDPNKPSQLQAGLDKIKDSFAPPAGAGSVPQTMTATPNTPTAVVSGLVPTESIPVSGLGGAADAVRSAMASGVGRGFGFADGGAVDDFPSIYGEAPVDDPMAYIREHASAPTLPDNLPANPPISGLRVTTYSPQRGGDQMEGGYEAARPGPDGQAQVRTLEDFRSGASPYVTIAGNPSLYGREYTIPQLSYSVGGQRYTLKDVPAVVHDTGGAFKSAPEGRFDVPIGRDLGYADTNQGLSGVQFVPRNPLATADASGKIYMNGAPAPQAGLAYSDEAYLPANAQPTGGRNVPRAPIAGLQAPPDGPIDEGKAFGAALQAGLYGLLTTGRIGEAIGAAGQTYNDMQYRLRGLVSPNERQRMLEQQMYEAKAAQMMADVDKARAEAQKFDVREVNGRLVRIDPRTGTAMDITPADVDKARAEAQKFDVREVNGRLVRIDPRTGTAMDITPAGLPTKAEYGLNPVWGVDAEGNPTIIQLGKDGKPIQTPLPPGVKVAKDPIRIDAGTNFVLLDPQTRQPVATVPKDISGTEREKVMGKAQGEALAALPTTLATADSMLNAISGIENDSSLGWGTGMLAGLTTSIPGTPTYDFGQKVEQLKGKAFLEAFNTLRGGGQITEVEGKKATDAIGRLSTSQTEEGFRQALKELREVVEAGKKRAMKKAGVSAEDAERDSSEASQSKASGSPQVGAIVRGYRFKGGNPADQFSWEKVN